MPRPEKVAVVDEVRTELESTDAILFTEYRGLSVADLAELRSDLREAGAQYMVVKNTLARIAARDAGYEDLDDVFVGPTAITFCGDGPVAPAKALRDFAEEHPQLVVKGGILEGRRLDTETAEKLADLETREQLLTRLASMMQNAIGQMARLLQAPITDAARLLAAFEDQVREAEQDEVAPEAAAQDEAAEEAAAQDEAAPDEAAEEAAAPEDAEQEDVAQEDVAPEAAAGDEADQGEDEGEADAVAEESEAPAGDESESDDSESQESEPNDESDPQA